MLEKIKPSTHANMHIAQNSSDLVDGYKTVKEVQ